MSVTLKHVISFQDTVETLRRTFFDGASDLSEFERGRVEHLIHEARDEHMYMADCVKRLVVGQPPTRRWAMDLMRKPSITDHRDFGETYSILGRKVPNGKAYVDHLREQRDRIAAYIEQIATS